MKLSKLIKTTQSVRYNRIMIAMSNARTRNPGKMSVKLQLFYYAVFNTVYMLTATFALILLILASTESLIRESNVSADLASQYLIIILVMLIISRVLLRFSDKGYKQLIKQGIFKLTIPASVIIVAPIILSIAISIYDYKHYENINILLLLPVIVSLNAINSTYVIVLILNRIANMIDMDIIDYSAGELIDIENTSITSNLKEEIKVLNYFTAYNHNIHLLIAELLEVKKHIDNYRDEAYSHNITNIVNNITPNAMRAICLVAESPQSKKKSNRLDAVITTAVNNIKIELQSNLDKLREKNKLIKESQAIDKEFNDEFSKIEKSLNCSISDGGIDYE